MISTNQGEGSFQSLFLLFLNLFLTTTENLRIIMRHSVTLKYIIYCVIGRQLNILQYVVYCVMSVEG